MRPFSADPGTDPEYCDRISEAPPAFTCAWCGALEEHDDTCWPYCSPFCAAKADGDSEVE